MGEALAVASLLLFSANVLLVPVASARLDQAPGFALALLANVLGAAVLLGAQAALTGPPSRVDWPALGLFALGGLLTSFLGRRTFFRSITAIGPTRAATLQTTNPAFAALGGWLLLGQALAPPAVLAGALVLVGLVLVTRVPSSCADPVSWLLPGTGLALLGAAAYGLGNVARGAAVGIWAEPVAGSLIGAVAGLLALLLVTGDRRGLLAALRSADPAGRRLWVLSGVLTIGAQTCLVAATQTVPVAVAVVVSAAVPVVVLPLGLLLGRETRLRPVAVAGVALVGVGVVALVLG
ncbi:EamA-like transporter family protein [Klenkia soli]|uniref:EamA-like transporter family protein n=1 Tax=Klenkia soli TaxID=1052260 RepID=A0A1H0Q896_9ACTN|nr:EamA family transporter [Klenkia soli]SDP13255.1 EamA-like transporter family protein [Klenkia soli]